MPPEQRRAGWTVGRIIVLVCGSILALASLGLLTGSAAALWADLTQRHDGFLTSTSATYSASGYALASDPVTVRGWHSWLASFAGQVRIRVTAVDPHQPVFLAVAPAPALRSYLSGVPYTSVNPFGNRSTLSHPGTAIPRPPAAAGIWTVQTAGTGTQALTWTVRGGDWMVVAMNADASTGVNVHADVGAQFPSLSTLALELMVTAFLLGVPAVTFIMVPVRMAAGPVARWL